MRRKCLDAFMALLQILSVQCSKPEPAVHQENIDEEPEPTVVTRFTVKGPMSSCELFIYREDELGSLAAHWTWMPAANDREVAGGGANELSAFIRLEKGRYSAVAVCNAYAPVNPIAVQRRDAFDSFKYSFTDENPASPLCCAAVEFEAGNDVTIVPRKHLCTVHLVSVCRQFRGELGRTVVQQPRVFLRNVPATVDILRERDFHPSGFIDLKPMPGTICRNLGSDLGYDEQRPALELYCYPNDSPGTDIAAPHTKIAIEGRLNGQYHCWEADLGPIGRGRDIYVEFVLYDENSCSCRVY